MIRYSLLLLAFTVTSATAQPLQLGPAARVAPFSTAAPGGDYGGHVVPFFDSFAAYWLRDGHVWQAGVSGEPLRPNPLQTVDTGFSASAIATTINGLVLLYQAGGMTFVRGPRTPESAATSLGSGSPDAIECNLTRCLASARFGNTLAVVDTDGLLVRLLPTPPAAQVRVAWATDPHGFLFLANRGDNTNRAISIDNNGNIRGDVQIDSLGGAVAATFNDDRYVIFNNDGFGVKGFTMTVDGQVSSPRKLITKTMMAPQAAVWNGSEDLLVGGTDLIATTPEVIPPNSLSGIRIAPDLTPIDAQPFQISPNIGTNSKADVSWNGSMFYAVWTRSFDSPFVSQPTRTSVEGAAISSSGDAVTRDLVSMGPISQTSPRVARGTSSSAVIWSEFNIHTGTSALRYSVNGHTGTAGTGVAIDVVPLGDDYLVAWADNGQTRTAVLSADGRFSNVALPAISSANAAVAANHDHWMIAGSVSPNLVAVTVSRNGTASAPVIVAPLPYLYGLASDGDRFFLAGTADFILDTNGNPIAEKQPNNAAQQVDFAGGVYGAIGPLGTFDRYDRNGNFIGSIRTSQYPFGNPQLSHIGSLFVIVETFGPLPLAAIVSADGAILAHGLPVPAVSIARTDGTTSIAVETRLAPDALNRQTSALFTESVSIAIPPPHRAVRH